jgi:hypothetical protein
MTQGRGSLRELHRLYEMRFSWKGIDMDRSNGNGITMTGLALGFLVGAATVLLAAPKSGKENRKMLSNRMNDIKNRVRGSQDMEGTDVEGMISRATKADYLH